MRNEKPLCEIREDISPLVAPKKKDVSLFPDVAPARPSRERDRVQRDALAVQYLDFFVDFRSLEQTGRLLLSDVRQHRRRRRLRVEVHVLPGASQETADGATLRCIGRHSQGVARTTSVRTVVLFTDDVFTRGCAAPGRLLLIFVRAF